MAKSPVPPARAKAQIPNAQQGEKGQPEPDESISPGQVTIEGRTVVTVYEQVGSFTPVERAQAIQERILTFARDTGVPANCIRLVSRDSWTELLCDKTLIMAVTDADSKTAGKPREQLAAEYAENIRSAVVVFRTNHSWRMLLKGIGKTFIATLILVLSIWGVFRFRRFLRRKIEFHSERLTAHKDKPSWHVLFRYIAHAFFMFGRLVKWLIVLALIDAYLTVVLGFFAATRDISTKATQWVFLQLELLLRSGVDYLPNLLVVAVVALGCFYVLQLIKLIFEEIRRGAVKLDGFYPEWAEPTEKLIRLFVMALAAVIAFPYLPGAKSPAFQGISIFLGVLLSLGSSSAVANAIAGIILTYMRSYSVGDWVQIGDVVGEVVEKNLLVTRVLTPKAEVITLPNSTVMNGSVKNYSSEARRDGVIFHTTVTIGYDAPWRTVHELLIDAALSTRHILPIPKPFVLQTALNDFYVSYELNAHTDTPNKMPAVYSELHQNIQDKFNDAGVEICSPHFASLRDGNTIAIPNQYIKPEHKSSGFQLTVTEDRAAKSVGKS